MIKYIKFKGKFIKHCPCSPEAISCGYYNINLHTGCPFNCTYCILQTYLETKEPIFYTNINDLKTELNEIIKEEKYLRIGTGELSDSLAYDNQTNYSNKIFDLFYQFKSIIFEFKTKSTNISNLLKRKNIPKNIVVSWSLNTKFLIKNEELLTPNLSERLKAIKSVQDKGFMIGIHFDPIIYYKNWKKDYIELINEISKIINPKQIAWWSLGALRFPYSLKTHILKFKESILFEGELIRGYDNKYRYFKPLRNEMFKIISSEIKKKISSEIRLYLCMEDEEMWNDIFPQIKPTETNINKYLYYLK